MKIRNLKYYMNLDYPIQIRKIADSDGIDYEASIPELGEWTFCAIGSTEAGAIKNLEQLKKKLFKQFLKEGKVIPEPEPRSESVFSGRFVIRTNMDLHRKLVGMAKKMNTSLNQYVIYLLSCGVGLDIRDDIISDRLDEIGKGVNELEQLKEFEVEQKNWGHLKYLYDKKNQIGDLSSFFSGR